MEREIKLSDIERETEKLISKDKICQYIQKFFELNPHIEIIKEDIDKILSAYDRQSKENQSRDRKAATCNNG